MSQIDPNSSSLPREEEHDYARQHALMETECSGDKRSLDEMSQQDPTTPSKGAHPRKIPKGNEDVSNATILAAIQTLSGRFDSQEKKLEELSMQMKQNSVVIASLTKALEFNAMEVKDCKVKVSTMEKEVERLRKDYGALQEKSKELDRYKRRWNLRMKGLPEKMNENTRDEVIRLLSKVAPHWEQKMDDIVDTVHRIGQRAENRTRFIIIQFTRRQHRDAFWKLTKDSRVCKEAGVKFVEDLTEEDRRAREALWPRISQAKKAGEKAYFRGPFGFINGRRIQV